MWTRKKLQKKKKKKLEKGIWNQTKRKHVNHNDLLNNILKCPYFLNISVFRSLDAWILAYQWNQTSKSGTNCWVSSPFKTKKWNMPEVLIFLSCSYLSLERWTVGSLIINLSLGQKASTVNNRIYITKIGKLRLVLQYPPETKRKTTST